MRSDRVRCVTPLAAASVLRVDGVSKVYDRVRTARKWRQARPGRAVEPRHGIRAVDRVTLAMDRGERVGIIGPNGAGKSTLLQLIAGVTVPTEGSIDRRGRLGALIELGVGFHPQLTGRENARASAALRGLSASEIDDVLPAVLEFAGIGDAVDAPLRHYSTGMRARLGFAVATHVPADLLIVDEVLAVGDAHFQERCVARIDALCEAGVSLLFVSHEMWLVDRLCERVVRLDDGMVIDDGASSPVIARYLGAPLVGRESSAGTDRLRLGAVELARDRVASWEPLELDIEVVVDEPVDGALIEMDFSWATDPSDQPICQTSHRLPGGRLEPGRHRFTGTTEPLPLDGGHGRIVVRLVDLDGPELADATVVEFWISSEQLGRRPQLAAGVRWHLAPGRHRDERGGASESACMSGPGAAVVRAVDVSKWFWPRNGLPARAAAPWSDAPTDGVVAVDAISLELRRGSALGLMGSNGAGKTTLLRLLAGATAPTAGEVDVEGRVVSMLDLGLGFHPERTGFDNAVFTGRMLGLTRQEAVARMGEISRFADIGDALHAPVNQYSTGMRARLGLAVALHVDADVVLIDEVLAVGDEAYRAKAVRAVRSLVDDGAAVVLASHDQRLVEAVCDRVLLMERGRMVRSGPVEAILSDVAASSEGGSRSSGEGVQLTDLQVDRRRVVVGGSLVLRGDVRVDGPRPGLSIEIRYFARGGTRHFTEMTDAERLDHTIFRWSTSTDETLGARLGRAAFECRLDRNVIVGEVDVAVLAIDRSTGDLLAECWRPVVFGTPRPDAPTAVMCPIDVRWSAVRSTAGRSRGPDRQR